MASTRQILSRRRAAQNINKVTGTMETISAVRYRHFYKSWAQGQEFYDSLARLVYLVVTGEGGIPHPLLHDNDSRTHALVVIGSDRGLCGAYNSNVFKLVEVHRRMAARFNRELKIYAKGNKVINFLRYQNIPVEQVYSDFEDVPSVEQTEEISNQFVNQYIKGDIGRLSVVYTRFFSAASQQAQTLSILPVAELIDDLTTRATVIWPWEVAYEDFLLSPQPEDIFDGLARMMIRTAISGCFHEAVLSEHLARVVAMRSASDNAEDMIASLTQEYNRERQSQITNELLDILGGALQ